MLAINPKSLCVCHAECRKGEWCQRWCARANDKSRDKKKAKTEEPEKPKRAYQRNEDGTPTRKFGTDPYKVLCTTTGVEYKSAVIAAVDADVSVSAIRYCCTGKLTNVRGLKFVYVEESK